MNVRAFIFATVLAAALSPFSVVHARDIALGPQLQVENLLPVPPLLELASLPGDVITVPVARSASAAVALAHVVNLPLSRTPVAPETAAGLRHFSSGVACSTPFQLMQIAQGIAAAATGPRQPASAAARSREAAITHQVDMGTCERFENRGYAVIANGVFDRFVGTTIAYVEAARTPDDGARITYPEDAGHIYLIYVVQ